MATPESFEAALGEVVKAKRLSASKMNKLTEVALEIVEFDTQIVSILYRTHKSLPTANNKISSLYTFDALARAARHQAVKRKITADAANPEAGNCATLLLKIDGVLDGLFNDMVGESKEKLKKVLDIWTKSQTFPPGTLQRLRNIVKDPDAGEKESNDVKPVTAVDPRTSTALQTPPTAITAPPTASTSAATPFDPQAKLLALLQAAVNQQGPSTPAEQMFSAPPVVEPSQVFSPPPLQRFSAPAAPFISAAQSRPIHVSPPHPPLPVFRAIPPTEPGQLPVPLGIPVTKPKPAGGLPNPLGIPTDRRPGNGRESRGTGRDPRGYQRDQGQQIPTFISDAPASYDRPSFPPGPGSYERPVPPAGEFGNGSGSGYSAPRSAFEQGSRGTSYDQGYVRPSFDPRRGSGTVASGPPSSYNRWDQPPNATNGNGNEHYPNPSSSMSPTQQYPSSLAAPRGKGIYFRESGANYDRDATHYKAVGSSQSPPQRRARGATRWDQPPAALSVEARGWAPCQRERSKSPPRRHEPPSSGGKRDNRPYSPPRRPVLADMSSSYPASSTSDQFGRELQPMVVDAAPSQSAPGLDQFNPLTFDFTDPSAWNALAGLWRGTYGWDPSQEELMQFVLMGGNVPGTVPAAINTAGAPVVHEEPEVPWESAPKPEPQPQHIVEQQHSHQSEPVTLAVPAPVPPMETVLGFESLKAILACKKAAKAAASIVPPVVAVPPVFIPVEDEDIDGDEMEDIDGEGVSDEEEEELPPDPRLRMRRTWKGKAVTKGGSSEDGDAMQIESD